VKRVVMLVAGAVALGLVTGQTGSATAASDAVDVTTKTVVKAKGAKARVYPKAAANGNVVIDSRRITVKKGGKTIVKNARSAKLPRGRYRATTTVKYRTWTDVQTTTNENALAHAAGSIVSARCEITDAGAWAGEYGVVSIGANCTSTNGSFDGSFRETGTWTDDGTGYPYTGDVEFDHVADNTYYPFIYFTELVGSYDDTTTLYAPVNLYKQTPKVSVTRSYTSHTKNVTRTLRVR
jgi:hypothetical protein